MIDYNKIIKSEKNLIQFVYSYNWDDGFKIPYKILEEKECTLQVALLIFEFADGITYLETKSEGLELPEWSKFISSLYDRILNGEFKMGDCVYNPELTKVQIYKLKKLLSEEEHIFITPINIGSENTSSDLDENNNSSVNLCDGCVRKRYEKPVLCTCHMCGENTMTEELKGASMLIYCSNCGYEVVGASFFPPCHDNEDYYTISIIAEDITKENKLRISKCFEIGVIELSKELSENKKIETTVKLDKTVKILAELKEMNIPFTTTTPQISEKYPDLPGCKLRGEIRFC